LTTAKFREPVAASAVIVKLAVKLVVLVTATLLTVMPEPTSTVVPPLIKFVPVKTTSKVCKRLPLAGAMLVNVGAGMPTLKV